MGNDGYRVRLIGRGLCHHPGAQRLIIFPQSGHPGQPNRGIVFQAEVAPLVEEIFFRGFLFQGFRQKYGWVNGMLLSSAIFAAAHLNLVVLIPTFILGSLLAYLYHRSNSIWPGVIVHFLVNTFALSVAYFIVHNPSLFPM